MSADPENTRRFYTYTGEAFDVPAAARTCYDGTGRWRTHWLFAADNPAMLSAQTLCGKRAGAIPGGDTVDCPECLDARRG